MMYTDVERPCGCGGLGGLARNSGGRQEQERRHKGGADSSSGTSTSKGSQGIARNGQAKTVLECWYCGKKDHRESECWKKRSDSHRPRSGSGRTEQGNYNARHMLKGRKDPKPKKGQPS